MIVFDKLWGVMKQKGISTYLLREKCGIDSKTVRRLRTNDNMETKTLNKLCSALDCRLEDIAEYVPAGAGKGRRGLAQTLSRTRKSGGKMERQQSSCRLILGGTKGIYSPRLSSRRSEISAAVCSADRPARPAPFSSPVFPSNESVPPSLG